MIAPSVPPAGLTRSGRALWLILPSLALLASCPRQDTHNMGTGVTCGFAATGDRAILQRAQIALGKEIVKKAPATHLRALSPNKWLG